MNMNKNMSTNMHEVRKHIDMFMYTVLT
jgi:hypothetical protein